MNDLREAPRHQRGRIIISFRTSRTTTLLIMSHVLGVNKAGQVEGIQFVFPIPIPQSHIFPSPHRFQCQFQNSHPCINSLSPSPLPSPIYSIPSYPSVYHISRTPFLHPEHPTSPIQPACLSMIIRGKGKQVRRSS